MHLRWDKTALLRISRRKLDVAVHGETPIRGKLFPSHGDNHCAEVGDRDEPQMLASNSKSESDSIDHDLGEFPL